MKRIFNIIMKILLIILIIDILLLIYLFPIKNICLVKDINIFSLFFAFIGIILGVIALIKKVRKTIKLPIIIICLGIVILIIGSLNNFFGVLEFRDCDMPIPQCVAGPGFSCMPAYAKPDYATLTLRQNLGQDLQMIELIFEGDVAEKRCTLSITNSSGDDWTNYGCNGNICKAIFNSSKPIRNGEYIGIFTFDNCTEEFDKRVIIEFNITYRVAGKLITHETSGKANLEVEK